LSGVMNGQSKQLFFVSELKNAYFYRRLF